MRKHIEGSSIKDRAKLYKKMRFEIKEVEVTAEITHDGWSKSSDLDVVSM